MQTKKQSNGPSHQRNQRLLSSEFDGSDKWIYDHGVKADGQPGAVYCCNQEGCHRRIKVRFFKSRKVVPTSTGTKQAQAGYYIVPYRKQAGGQLMYPAARYDYDHSHSVHVHELATTEVADQDNQPVDNTELSEREEERVWDRFGKSAEALFHCLEPVAIWRCLFDMHGAADASGIRIPPHVLIAKKKRAWTSRNTRFAPNESHERELAAAMAAGDLISAQSVKGMCMCYCDTMYYTCGSRYYLCIF
jgi:hypothetical protein